MLNHTRLRTALEAGRLPDEAAGAFATHLAAGRRRGTAARSRPERSDTP
ncbi:hypothetical protein [Streptomyces sp. NPDC051135]